jgi:hypothetical protein
MNINPGKGFGTPLWRQLQQVKVTRNDGIQAPVTADGEHGIVIGNPPIELTAAEPEGVRRPGVLSRLLARFRRD